MKRFQKQKILADLQKKMVILSGPRQVGKTWLSHEIMKHYEKPIYLNYDNFKHQKIIKDQLWLSDNDLIVFDELHKMKNWKLFLKGVYDTKKPHQHILVTGSARLDAYNQMGESLAGRFFRHRLFPYSLMELNEVNAGISFDELFQKGGFPEPLLSDNLNETERWRFQYVNGLIREDILDFERVHDIKKIKYLIAMLQERVGSPISYESIARDLELHAGTVKKYITILEALFIVFIVKPYSKSISRSILKEPKIYFYDIGLVEEKGPRFENVVGLHLLQTCQFANDYLGIDKELHYIRTKDQKEVDFAIRLKNSLHQIIECKYQDDSLSKHLKYFSNNYDVQGMQLVKELKKEYQIDRCKVLTVENFFAGEKKII